MKKKVDPRQLLLSFENTMDNSDSEEFFAVEHEEIKKATILKFNSITTCSEGEKHTRDKKMLLSVAQKLKW